MPHLYLYPTICRNCLVIKNLCFPKIIKTSKGNISSGVATWIPNCYCHVRRTRGPHRHKYHKKNQARTVTESCPVLCSHPPTPMPSPPLDWHSCLENCIARQTENNLKKKKKKKEGNWNNFAPVQFPILTHKIDLRWRQMDRPASPPSCANLAHSKHVLRFLLCFSTYIKFINAFIAWPSPQASLNIFNHIFLQFSTEQQQAE